MCVGVRLILYMMTLIPVDCCNSCMSTPIVNLQRRQLPGLVEAHAVETYTEQYLYICTVRMVKELCKVICFPLTSQVLFLCTFLSMSPLDPEQGWIQCPPQSPSTLLLSHFLYESFSALSLHCCAFLSSQAIWIGREIICKGLGT